MCSNEDNSPHKQTCTMNETANDTHDVKWLINKRKLLHDFHRQFSDCPNEGKRIENWKRARANQMVKLYSSIELRP